MPDFRTDVPNRAESVVQVTRQVLSVISVSVLARRILAAIYGLVGMAVLVTNLLETICDVGTGIAVPQQPISDFVRWMRLWPAKPNRVPSKPAC